MTSRMTLSAAMNSLIRWDGRSTAAMQIARMRTTDGQTKRDEPADVPLCGFAPSVIVVFHDLGASRPIWSSASLASLASPWLSPWRRPYTVHVYIQSSQSLDSSIKRSMFHKYQVPFVSKQ